MLLLCFLMVNKIVLILVIYVSYLLNNWYFAPIQMLNMATMLCFLFFLKFAVYTFLL